MLNVIVTPRALRGKGKKIFRKVQSRLCESGTPHRLLYTERKGDATEFARRLTEEGEREICVMGGDGAINDVLNGLTCVEECTLGVIPAGTGNDFAASARIPRGEKALELILGGEAKPTDYILFDDGRRALNIAGLGIDVDILRRCERMKRFRAKTKYFISLLVSLAKYRGCKIRVEVDGERREHTALIAAVCNGSRLGGGIPLCPPAGISDGLL
ncbi:MAG: diacylglycerol/lipid kinase family protein, partial [Candidatus Gallimonas sp.]